MLILENHIINIDNRSRISITDVADVDSFNEEVISIILNAGAVTLKGKELHIQKLDLDQGQVVITGKIQGLVYSEKKEKQEKGFLKKLLK